MRLHLSKGETYMKEEDTETLLKVLKQPWNATAIWSKHAKIKSKSVRKNKSRSQASASCRNHQTYHRQKSLEFGCETKTTESIKIESLPEQWTAISDADWCQVTPGEKKLSISCQTNWLTTERKATITISNERWKLRSVLPKVAKKNSLISH